MPNWKVSAAIGMGIITLLAAGIVTFLAINPSGSSPRDSSTDGAALDGGPGRGTEKSNLGPFPPDYEPTSGPPQAEVVFFDDFNAYIDSESGVDNGGFNESMWVRLHDSPSQPYYQGMLFSDNNVVLHPDQSLVALHLTQEGADENGVKQETEGGALESQPLWGPGHRFEIRAKLPAGPNARAVVRMEPEQTKTKYGHHFGQILMIDYESTSPSKITQTAEYSIPPLVSINGRQGQNYSRATEGVKAQDLDMDLSADFHIYSLDWSRDSLIFAVDGKELAVVLLNRILWRGTLGDGIPAPYTSPGQPFDEDFFLTIEIINLNPFSNHIDPYNSTFALDYVKVETIP